MVYLLMLAVWATIMLLGLLGEELVRRHRAKKRMLDRVWPHAEQRAPATTVKGSLWKPEP